MKGRRILIARYAFAIGAIALLVVLVDIDDLTRALRRTDPALAIAGIAFGYVAWALNTWKWQLLLAGRRVHVRFARLFRLNLTSALYGTVLPGQVAGEAVKLFRLSREPRDRSVLVTSVVVDRLTGLVGLIAVGLVGTFASGEEPAAVQTVLLASLACCVGAGIWMLRPRESSDDIPTGGRIATTARKFLVALADYREARGSLAAAVGLSVVFQALVTCNVWIFAEALNLSVGAADLAWIVAVVSVVQLLPITVASIGTRDAAFIVLLASVGVGRADAVALSLLMLAGNVGIALGGACSELLPGDGSARAVDEVAV